MIEISYLTINSTESLQHDQNYDQQAKDTLFWNGLQCLLFLFSIAGTTGINMSVENNMLHLLCQTNLKKGANPCFSEFFFVLCFDKFENSK